METKTNKHEQSLMSYYIPSANTLKRLSSFYAVFSDPSRVKILSCLSIAELCVSDLARYCAMEQSTVSHQLQILRAANLVSTRREGKVIFYSISSNYVAKTLEIGADYLQH